MGQCLIASETAYRVVVTEGSVMLSVLSLIDIAIKLSRLCNKVNRH